MKKARACRKCGCTETKSCIEFDSKGRGYPCWWYSADVCSACVPDHKPMLPLASPFEELPPMPLVVAPQLAGYVARARR